MKRRSWFRKAHALVFLHFAAAITAVTAVQLSSASGSSLSTPHLIAKARSVGGTTVSATSTSASDLDAIIKAPNEVEPAEPPSIAALACPMSLNSTESEICLATNRERTARGLQLVYWDPALARVANDFAKDMNDRDYFSHQSPEGRTMKNRIEAAAIEYGYAGENIALGYSNGYDVAAGWMNSAGHRANLLKPEYSRIGAAQVGDRFVQLFTGELK